MPCSTAGADERLLRTISTRAVSYEVTLRMGNGMCCHDGATRGLVRFHRRAARGASCEARALRSYVREAQTKSTTGTLSRPSSEWAAADKTDLRPSQTEKLQDGCCNGENRTYTWTGAIMDACVYAGAAALQPKSGGSLSTDRPNVVVISENTATSSVRKRKIFLNNRASAQAHAFQRQLDVSRGHLRA